MNSLLTVITVAGFLTASAVAQLPPVELTGTVRAVSGTPCDPRVTHTLDCTNAALFSSTLDLDTYIGRTVDLTATLQGSLGCLVLDVTQVQAAAASTSYFALFGIRPGSRVVITTVAPVGSLVSYVFGFGPGLVPLPMGLGTFLIDPVGSVYWATDVSIGVALRTLTIPNDPALIGVQALFQTNYVSLTPTFGLRFLNNSCFTVSR